MSKIQWEYDLVERPFCAQLKAMGWQWIEGDTDVPDFTERANFGEVSLKGRLNAALRKLNLRDGQFWLDDDRIRRIIEKLEKAEGHRLMEINESATRLLLRGTEIDGLPDWNFGRNQPVRFIDFENPANNDFLVINQFKVELTSGRGHVIPDAVLFVNGIPPGVAEFKSPGIENPLQEAINQLLRYSNQRREIFGDFIDKYILQDAELDGATVPILYGGRTADGIVKDAPSLDAVFEDMFRDYTPEELAIIKAKYATEGDVMEAPLLIEQKARDLIRHFANVVLPEGFKAQVVATSRQACMTYVDKLDKARDELIAELEAVPAATLALPDDEVEKLDAKTRFLVRTHPQLPKLRALETAAVFSGNHNDPASWWDWADKGRQEEFIKRFKRKFDPAKTEKTDPLSILVVMNMLLTGFDAPVEQVLYLDRKIVAHDLLQAVARVNRTCGQKKCGYVVDYIGVARHLNEALTDYDGEDIEGALINISVELPKLLDRRARAVAVFTGRGIADLQGQVDACVQLLEDLKIRADFINKLRSFYEMLGLLEHRPEVPGDVFRDAKLLGFINKVAANLYRDPALNLFGVAEKVKSLINAHVSARGVDPKIPPTAITDAEFERVLQAQSSSRARAAQMQHAARYHIIGFSTQNPAYARKMSERLEEILQKFKDDWNALERELRKFIDELRQGDRNDFPELDAKVQVPFARLVLEECSKGPELTAAPREQAIKTTLDIVERIRQEVRKVGFWKNEAMRELLTKALVRDLNKAGVCRPGGERDLAQRLVALAKENHENLTRA